MSGNEEWKSSTDESLAEHERLSEEMYQEWSKLPAAKQDRLMAIRDFGRRGMTTVSMAKLLGVSVGTVSKDLEWIKKYWERLSRDFSSDEYVGHAMTVLQEVEDKAFVMFEDASREQEVDRVVDDKVVKVKVLPDTDKANRCLSTVLMARREMTALVKDAGVLKVSPDRGVAEGDRLDDLRGEALVRKRDELASKVIELRSRFDRIGTGSKIKGVDSGGGN